MLGGLCGHPMLNAPSIATNTASPRTTTTDSLIIPSLRRVASVKQAGQFVRNHGLYFFQADSLQVARIAVLEPPAKVLLYRLQGDQGIAARESITVLPLVIRVAHVES